MAARLTPLTRVYGLPPGDRKAAPLLHESHGYLPVLPPGGFLRIGDRTWRVRYCTVAVNEARGEAVLVYTVQDAREAVRA
jgi:hypothetical protein